MDLLEHQPAQWSEERWPTPVTLDSFFLIHLLQLVYPLAIGAARRLVRVRNPFSSVCHYNTTPPPPPIAPPPVYLSLSSTTYLSGLSEIPLSSVGEGSGLICHTDLADCCEGDTEDWYYPNGSVVMEDGALYISRGQMSVSLMMSGTATAPGGVYCCVVPNSGGRDTACIVLVNIGWC